METKNENGTTIINDVVYGNEKSIKFENVVELNNWWCMNPKAVRTSPIPPNENLNIDEYNNWNHSIEFPCEMSFVFPIKVA